jgi:hypothetical protein
VAYQEVEVSPNTAYRASVWVSAADPHGHGFGTRPGDSAGLILQELDENGQPLLDHPKVAVTVGSPRSAAQGYAELSQSVVTTPTTARVRFIVDTEIGEPYNEGHVTYDDCSLDRLRSGR